MNRYMKNTHTGSIHIYEPAWLAQEDHNFVECDAEGRYLNPVIEDESSIVDGDDKPKAKSKSKPKAKLEEPKSDIDMALEEAIEAAEEALSADASNIK